MKFNFTAVSRVTLDNVPGELTSRHIATDIRLEISNNLDHHIYLKKGLPTKEGATLLTKALVSGLSANIHACHQKGYKDSAEHLREVIKQLEEEFITVADIQEGKM